MQNFKVMDAMVIKFAIVDTTYGTFRGEPKHRRQARIPRVLVSA
jgi:hypothetical protein